MISFTLRLRKSGKMTNEVRSCNKRTLNTDNFKTDILSVLTAVSGPADTARAYKACLRELLDKHVPLVTHRSYVRALDDPGHKAGQAIRRCAERQWREISLTAHLQIYAHRRSVVNRMMKYTNKRRRKKNCAKKSQCLLFQGTVSSERSYDGQEHGYCLSVQYFPRVSSR